MYLIYILALPAFPEPRKVFPDNIATSPPKRHAPATTVSNFDAETMTNFSDLKNKSSGHRTHSLGACKTCRRRHVRCDQARPICKACRAANAVCECLTSEITWVGSTSTDRDMIMAEASSGPNVRRQLYTEEESQKMSLELVSKLAPFSVDQFLTEIDTQSKHLEEQPEGEMLIGPFGVLHLVGDSIPESIVETLPSRFLIESTAEESPSVSTSSFPELSTAEAMLGNLDSYLQWADIFNLDPVPVEGLLTPPALGHEESNRYVDLASPTMANMSARGREHNLAQDDSSNHQSTGQNPDILSEAKFLLRHFQEHVLAQIIWTPMPRKSPWAILHIPSAMITLGQLTYMTQHTIKHANLANLYAILACSSYYLAMNPQTSQEKPTQYWGDSTGLAYNEAKFHMNKSLELEFDGAIKAKYKELLMALLGITTYSILSQNLTETRSYLINMEHLIRLRGLVKPKLSRRARLLHHQYTWIRILAESTLVIHNQISHSAPCKALRSRRLDIEEMNRLAQRRATIPPYEESRGIDDFLRIAPAVSNSEANIEDPKESQAYLGDIHLADAQNVPGEQHTTINGVSETWLSLLSQTTRLANVMDQCNSGSCNMSAEQQLALHRRSLCLENMICSFTSIKAPPSNGAPKSHMLQALNSALVIYFYRRVRQVNPCILQGYVTQVIDELYKWDEALARNDLVGPGTAWPAFIAGCEAIGNVERDVIFQWLVKASNRSGFASYAAAREVMEEVWKRRDTHCGTVDPPVAQPGGPMSYSWIDYSRQSLRWPLLL